MPCSPTSPRGSSPRPTPGDPDERIAAWEQDNAEGLARARLTLEEIAAVPTTDLATLSVALRTIRTLLRAGSPGAGGPQPGSPPVGVGAT